MKQYRVSKFSKNVTRIILPGLILVFGLTIYLTNITRSGLWADEAIEYFFSKYLCGIVPGGGDMINMYERIIHTFQPPLYNCLMYIWLKIIDTGDFSFRLAGVITTLIGSIGIYKCTNELCGKIYACLGMALYIVTPAIAYYALECAEYNLMLCCASWMLYYFVLYIKKHSLCSLILFFVFSCLSAYSQYGVSFFVFSLYLIILFDCFYYKINKKRVLIITAVVFIVAVLPLIVLFLIPQMANQGVTVISHIPVFRFFMPVDFIVNFFVTLKYIFCDAISMPSILKRVIFSIVFCWTVLTAIAVFVKNKLYNRMVIALMFTFTFYYILTACSFYGHNSWDASMGTYNIGGRYSLFLVPIYIVTLVYGINLFLSMITVKKNKQISYVIVSLLVIILLLTECNALYRGWTKEDIREITQMWYDYDGTTTVTVVNSWSDPIFQFYLRHNSAYDESFQKLILTEGRWSWDADCDVLRKELPLMDIFSYDDIFYIGPSNSAESFSVVMSEYGYNTKTVYTSFNSHSCLLRFIR